MPKLLNQQTPINTVLFPKLTGRVYMMFINNQGYTNLIVEKSKERCLKTTRHFLEQFNSFNYVTCYSEIGEVCGWSDQMVQGVLDGYERSLQDSLRSHVERTINEYYDVKGEIPTDLVKRCRSDKKNAIHLMDRNKDYKSFYVSWLSNEIYEQLRDLYWAERKEEFLKYEKTSLSRKGQPSKATVVPAKDEDVYCVSTDGWDGRLCISLFDYKTKGFVPLSEPGFLFLKDEKHDLEKKEINKEVEQIKKEITKQNKAEEEAKEKKREERDRKENEKKEKEVDGFFSKLTLNKP